MSTAFVYSPFLRTVTLWFGGREFSFPPKSVTTLTDQQFKAPDEYKRNLTDGTEEDRKAEHTWSLDAYTLGQHLLKRHHLDLLAAGFVVSRTEITEAQKAAANVKGRQYGTNMVAEFFQERRERQSGGMGRLVPFDEEIEWMKELNIWDDLYNPRPRQPILGEEDLAALGTAVGIGVIDALNERAGRK